MSLRGDLHAEMGLWIVLTACAVVAAAVHVTVRKLDCDRKGGVLIPHHAFGWQCAKVEVLR